MGNPPGTGTLGQDVAACPSEIIPGMVPGWAQADRYQQDGLELTFRSHCAGRCWGHAPGDMVAGGQATGGAGRGWGGEPSTWTGNMLPASSSLLCHHFPAWPQGSPCVFDGHIRVGVPQTCPPAGDMCAGSCHGEQPGINDETWELEQPLQGKKSLCLFVWLLVSGRERDIEHQMGRGICQQSAKD